VSLGGKKSKGIKHKDAVIDLAWNTINRNILASGSADHTVVLWNLAEQKPLSKLSVFEEKVQSIKWHPAESSNLLAGSCEGKVRLFDCRSTSTFKTWAFDGEIEKVLWNKFDPLYFFATNDKGMIHYVDIRNPKPVWNLKAHDKEVTGIALSSHCPDLLITGSMDETVKVWDLKDDKPHFVANKVMNIGSIYSLASCPDVPYVFCAGGSKKDNSMYLWDVRESSTVVERFQDRNLESTAVQPLPATDTMEDDSPASSSGSTPLSLGNLGDGRIQKKNKIVQSLRNESSEGTATINEANASSTKSNKKSKK
jgi:WD40 repeat protein